MQMPWAEREGDGRRIRGEGERETNRLQTTRVSLSMYQLLWCVNQRSLQGLLYSSIGPCSSTSLVIAAARLPDESIGVSIAQSNYSVEWHFTFTHSLRQEFCQLHKSSFILQCRIEPVHWQHVQYDICIEVKPLFEHWPSSLVHRAM